MNHVEKMAKQPAQKEKKAHKKYPNQPQPSEQILL
jgi:hypothetical protein